MTTMKDIVINNMIDEVCNRFGFEDKRTINFCTFCEKTNNFTMIKNRFNKIMK